MRNPVRRWSSRILRSRWTLFLVVFTASGCTALSYVAPITGELRNLSDEECSQSLSTAVVASLQKQGETPEDAADATGRALRIFSRRTNQDFLEAASSSGASYWFSFKPQKSGCLLRLYGRHKPSGATTTNTFTYYAKRPLTGCSCSWELPDNSSTP